MRKIIAKAGELRRQASLRGRLGGLLAASLLCPLVASTEEAEKPKSADESSAKSSPLLSAPMLEADFLSSDPVAVLQNPPDLLDVPLPSLRPSPQVDSVDPPLLYNPNDLGVSGKLALFEKKRPANVPAPEETQDETVPAIPADPAAALPGDTSQPTIAEPQTPDPNTFATPQIAPPATVPPDIYGVPNPILNPAMAMGEEIAPYTQVRLARRYALQLRAGLSGVYDDAAEVSQTGTKPDLILSFVPELAFTMGTDQSRAAIRMAYAPALTWYTQGTNKDGVNQNGRFDARYKTEKLLLGANFAAATSVSGGTLDTGPASESQTYLTTLTSLYQITGRSSVDLTLDDTVLKYSGSNSNSNELRLQGFANYRPSGSGRASDMDPGKFNFGLGTLVGLLDTQGESSQRYIQPLARVVYTFRKLSFTAVGGYEFRDLGGGNGHSTSPIYQFATSYQLFPKTTLILDTGRHVFASSSSGGQNYVLISFNGTIRQAFTGGAHPFFIGLSGGFQQNKYSDGNGPSPQPGGVDEYFYVRGAFDWAFREKCLFGAFYEYSEESPGRPGNIGFKRNRIGLQATVIFF